MYQIEGAIKRDPAKRWALPDRIFFACGACHILAFAFLERYPAAGFRPFWFKPAKGHTGNHIVVRRDRMAFDYHGYSSWDDLAAHMNRKAGRWWAGWNADVIELPPEVLVSEAKSRTFDGLWLRGPEQFLHNALPRAHRFLERFPAPR